jgi:protein TonB
LIKRAVSGHPLFIRAAVDSAYGWRFEPTLLNGAPVRVTGIVTFNFRLN